MSDQPNSELDQFFDEGEAPPAPVVEAVEPPAAEPAPEPQPEPTPEPEPEQPRDDNGRFAPVKALQEERAKRQAAEDRLREIESRQQPQPQQQPIDPYDDPEAFRQQIIAENQLVLAEHKLTISDQLARQAHGSEKVDAAVAWALERAQADPAFGPRYMAQANPVDFIVRQHEEATEIERFRADPVAFAKAVLEKHGQGAAPLPAAAPAPAASASAPPRSIASAPSVTNSGAGDVPLGTKATVTAAFTR